MTSPKIFIIGLPRTATTSLSVAMLELGFTVAHTAYTHKAFSDAQVMADTPIYCDYQILDKRYPNSLFIYLSRDLPQWLPSIKQLLNRMSVNLLRDDGGFNPSIKRCFTHIFSPFTEQNINDDAFLTACYLKHQQQVLDYFANRSQDLFLLNLREQGSYQGLIEFLTLQLDELPNEFKQVAKQGRFPQLNTGAKVTAWKEIKHPRKIESTNKGRVELK